MQRLFRFNDWPMRTKLIAAISGFLAVIGVVAGIILAVTTTNSLQSQLEDQMTVLAGQEGTRIGHWLGLQIDLVEASLATDDSVTGSVEEQTAAYTGTDADILESILALDEAWRAAPEGAETLHMSQVLDNELAHQLQDFVARDPDHAEVLVTDSHGALVAASGRTSDYYQADEEWWQRGWNNGEGAVWVGQPLYDESASTYSIEIVLPIMDVHTGEIVGVIKSVYDIASIGVEAEHFHLGETGHEHVITSDGTLVGGPHPEDIGGPLSEELTLGGAIFSGAGFTPRVVGEEGEAFVMAYAPVQTDGRYPVIDDLGWVVQVAQARSEAFAIATRQTVIVAVAVVGAALAGVGLSTGLAALLTRQVNELRKVFRGVIVGNFNQRATVLGRDELGEVADGLNAMLTLLTNLLAESGQLADQRLAILDATTDLVGIGGLDGRVLYMNAAGLAMGGHADVEDTTMLTIADFYSPEEGQRIATEVLPTVLERGIWSGEATLQQPDGTRIPTTHVVVLLKNDEGEPVGFANIARDISEQKAAEAMLLQQKAILDATTDFVGIADMEANALYVNPAGMAMLGRAEEEPASLAISDFQSGDAFNLIAEVAIPTALERGAWSGETTFTHKDGTRIPVSQVVMVLRDESGVPFATATIARDITGQRRVIDEVEGAAAEVTGASASMAEIVQLLTEQAASSAQTAEQATESAMMGNQAVAQTVAAMTRIRDNTQETARRIKRLGETTQEISEAVRFIEELADRTTVLALNASIQAAAAGEAGRGFAVVAEEVQRLAERATGATRQIEELVKNIQAETNEAVVGIEDATREVVEGSQLAQEAGDRMAELNQLIGHLATLIEHVAETTAAQTGESMSALTELSVGLWESIAGFGTRGGDGHDGDGHVN